MEAKKKIFSVLSSLGHHRDILGPRPNERLEIRIIIIIIVVNEVYNYVVKWARCDN